MPLCRQVVIGARRLLGRAIRAHGNLVEYVVVALLPTAFAELHGAPGRAAHRLGMALLAGHLRVLGVQLTFIAIIAATLINMGLALASWLPA